MLLSKVMTNRIIAILVLCSSFSMGCFYDDASMVLFSKDTTVDCIKIKISYTKPMGNCKSLTVGTSVPSNRKCSDSAVVKGSEIPVYDLTVNDTLYKIKLNRIYSADTLVKRSVVIDTVFLKEKHQ